MSALSSEQRAEILAAVREYGLARFDVGVDRMAHAHTLNPKTKDRLDQSIAKADAAWATVQKLVNA